MSGRVQGDCSPCSGMQVSEGFICWDYAEGISAMDCLEAMSM